MWRMNEEQKNPRATHSLSIMVILLRGIIYVESYYINNVLSYYIVTLHWAL